MRNVTFSIAGILMSAAVLFSSCSKSATMTASTNTSTHVSVKSSADLIELNNHAPVASAPSELTPVNTVEKTVVSSVSTTPVSVENEKPVVSSKVSSRINAKVEKINAKIEELSLAKADPNNIKKGEEHKNTKAMNEKVRLGLILFIVGILAGIILNAVGAWQVSVIGWIVAVVGLVFIVLGLLEI